MLQHVDGLINASNQERRCVSWGYPCQEEQQGSFILLPYQGSHAHTNTCKHFSSKPMQPARLSLREDRGWHLPRSWLPVFSLDGVILADALPPLPTPSTTRKAAGWRQGRSPFKPQLPPPALWVLLSTLLLLFPSGGMDKW